LNSRLVIVNRQSAAPVEIRLLRRLTQLLMKDLLGKNDFTLGICLVNSLEMARLNETFLDHPGSTDVITFDYARASSAAPPVKGRKGSPAEAPHGEIFICMDEAIVFARRFRTSWQMELARYVVHGVLHLSGYDDLHRRARRVMKHEENRLLRELARRLPLPRLKRPRPAARKTQGAKRQLRTLRRFPLSKRSRRPKMRS
jgi:probable rRNA maturation factor